MTLKEIEQIELKYLNKFYYCRVKVVFFDKNMQSKYRKKLIFFENLYKG